MVIRRLFLLFIFNWILIESAELPVLKWHHSHFRHVETPLRFRKNQRVSISCEARSYGTVVEVSEQCFDSCRPEDCKSDKGVKGREFFTCNHPKVGPVAFRTMSAGPNGYTFTVNHTHYFTSLDEVQRNGAITNFCRDGMKFKVIVSDVLSEEGSSTTMEHPLFSTAHNHHTHPASPYTENTKGTTVTYVETTPTEIRVDERTERPREEPIQMPMLTDKEQLSIEEMENLYRLTNYPPTPTHFDRTQRLSTNMLRNHKFARIGNTVMYKENGDIDENGLYEVALPLGIDPNPSSSRLPFISVATVIFLLAYLL